MAEVNLMATHRYNSVMVDTDSDCDSVTADIDAGRDSVMADTDSDRDSG